MRIYPVCIPILKSVLTFWALSLSLHLPGQSAHRQLRAGDAAYKKGDYSQAEKAYRKADEQHSGFKSGYNLGNTLYRQERYEEASDAYRKSAQKTSTDKEKSDAWHNLGNSLFLQQKYKESIDAYKNALKYHPESDDTRQNLMLAKTMLRQQQSQPQNQNQQNQNQNQPQDSNQQQNPQENNKQNKPQDEPQSPSSGNDQNAEKPQQNPPPQPSGMKKEDAEKLLNIIDNEDKKVQEKLRRASGSGKKSGKDW